GAPHEAGHQREESERCEIDYDERICPPPESGEEPESQDPPAPPSIRDEDRVGGEQTEIAEQHQRGMRPGRRETPLGEHQRWHGEDREPEYGGVSLQEPSEDQPARPEYEQRDRVREEVVRERRRPCDAEPQGEDIRRRRTEVLRTRVGREVASENLD